jgi:hypothetical protein
MSSAKLLLRGIADERVRMKKLPTTLAGKVLDPMTEIAKRTVKEIAAAYPSNAKLRKSTAKGSRARAFANLRKGLKVERTRKRLRTDTLIVSTKIVQRAPHAHLYELGTMARHLKTAIVGNRIANFGTERGSMPARPTFWPRFNRAKKEIEVETARVLREEGIRLRL